MALADFAAYKAALENSSDFTAFTIPTFTVVAGRISDSWTTQVPVGTAPTTAAAPTRTTAGALEIQNGGAGVKGVVSARINLLNPGMYLLCDRLSHQGGLVGNVTTSQTTNLATAALTRHTDGVGVMMGLSVYTQIGSTGSTVTVTYTDTADASKTSPAIMIGGTGFREAGRMLVVPLASGGVGVKSVQSLIINTTSTGTAGAFGVTLFMPVAAIIADEQHAVAVCDLLSGRLAGGFDEVIDDACLFVACISQGVSAAGAGGVILAEW